MQQIQSSSVFFYIRAVGDTNWKILVCLSQSNMPVASQINETDTIHCGVAVGIGNVRLNPTGTAVCEAAPTGGKATYEDLLDWQLKKTLIEFKTEYPDQGSAGYGGNFFLYSQGYVTATELQSNANDVIKFTFTLSGVGEPINQPF